MVQMAVTCLTSGATWLAFNCVGLDFVVFIGFGWVGVGGFASP